MTEPGAAKVPMKLLLAAKKRSLDQDIGLNVLLLRVAFGCPRGPYSQFRVHKAKEGEF